MSLSSFLLKDPGRKSSRGLATDAALDTDLDAVFQSNVSATRERRVGLGVVPVKKKKRKRVHEDQSQPESSKATATVSKAKTPRLQKDMSREPVTKLAVITKGDSTMKGKRKAGDQDSNTDGDESELDANYPSKKKAASESDSSKDSDDDGETGPLVHESVSRGATSGGSQTGSGTSKMKYTPPDETSEQRDMRTIFIGNLPVEVASKKSLLKKLQRHIISYVPSAKIESTRFRSVAFQAPTSKLPNVDGKGAAPPAKPKEARAHDRERTSSWRQTTGEKGDGTQADEKKFLTPKEKKKIAFIKHEFHSAADTVHAYVVFAHPSPTEKSRPTNLPPLPPTMDPYEAAKMAVRECNGTTFMERVIRVDHIRKSASGYAGEATALNDVDPKLNVFIGNLDFASKEEDLRVFFEGLVAGERGPRAASEGQDGGDARLRNWVSRVRVIRDPETQLGKGFAYVQFADRECVDEVLALEESKLKFAKRKLRVQRCKTVPGQEKLPQRAPQAVSTPPKRVQPKAPAVTVLKGDPTLGTKLAGLSKDERKKVKSTDAERVARRLAKKKARNALAKDGLKPQGKDRERVRKGPKTKKQGAAPPQMRSKPGRIRSEASVAKKNAKK